MAVEELMGWVDGRWVKSNDYKQYRVSIRQLKKVYPDLITADTQAGSRKAANQWWLDKLSELSKPTFVETRIDQMIEWSKRTGNAEAAKQLEELKADKIDPMKVISNQGKAVWVDRLEQSKKSSEATDTATKLAADWLTSKKLKVVGKERSPGHWDNLRREITAFVNWFGSDRSVKEIDGLVFAQWHDHLQNQVLAGTWSAHNAKRYQGTSKTWINWLYETDQILKLPKNLKNQDLIFHVENEEPIPWTKEELHFVLSYCNGKPMELWLHLMANCGMTQSEIAAIKHDDVDWKNGTLTIGRNKTKRSTRVPTVTYPLWKTTFELLKQFRSKDPELVLVNELGKPLWQESLGADGDEDEGYSKYDNIQSQYYDLKLLIKASNPEWEHKGLKQLRKTGPSLLRESPQFSSIRQLFLRHAHETVADINYAGIPKQLLNDAVLWLGKQLGIK